MPYRVSYKYQHFEQVTKGMVTKVRRNYRAMLFIPLMASTKCNLSQISHQFLLNDFVLIELEQILYSQQRWSGLNIDFYLVNSGQTDGLINTHFDSFRYV